jgi:cold shock CspA family protein
VIHTPIVGSVRWYNAAAGIGYAVQNTENSQDILL